MRAIVTALAVLLLAGAGAADPVSVKTAEKMLFRAKGFEVAINRAAPLSELEKKTLEQMFKANAFPYYGAVAYAPGQGLVAEPTFMAQNLHSPEAANTQALSACNAKRSGGPDCVIAANVVPRDWTPQTLTLNQGATADLRAYKKGRGPKAMAISETTGIYSIAKGPGAERAAMNDCLAKAQPLGAKDCTVVIADN